MIEEEINYYVKVVNAFKSYGKNNVLDGLNMNVQSNIIYGLLGPSGCGKSTLLQCILGTSTLDYGCIEFKANNVKDVGYMPQNLCLEENLTVNETLKYYGALYNMNQSDIDNRIEAMNTFLHLPNLNSYINKISGGQNRRVSLAVSLLHDSKIIILDEPTVGIDPILRQEIWAEFKRMVEQCNKTIIITTHYIEETNQANCIGLMRNGQLVEEGPPQDMLMKYGTETLEATFLTLCCIQKSDKVIHDGHRQKPQQKQIANKGNKFELYKIKALIKKNYNVGSRDYALLFSMIVLPLMQIFNVGFAVGVNFLDMPIAVKNDEIDILQCQYFNASGCIFEKNNNQTMSCVVLNYLESQNYKLINVESRKADEMQLAKSNYLAFLYFPKNYTNELIEYIDDRENYNRDSRIYAYLTKTNYIFNNIITKDLLESVNVLLRKTLKACSNNQKSVGSTLKINTIYGKDVKSYQNSSAALAVAILAFYFPAIYAATVMMSEKMNEIFNRSIYAGVSILELVTSMFILNTVLHIFQSFFACFVAYVIFLNPIIISKSLFVYLLSMLLLNCIGFFFGVLVAVVVPTVLGGTYVITGATLSQFMLSGLIWPIEGQPYFLKVISELLPITLVGNMMSQIALKGWSLNNPSILMGTSIAITYIVVLILSLVVLGKFKRDLWIIQK